MNDLRAIATILMLIVGIGLFVASFLVEPNTGLILLRFAFSAACFAMALKPTDE